MTTVNLPDYQDPSLWRQRFHDSTAHLQFRVGTLKNKIKKKKKRPQSPASRSVHSDRWPREENQLRRPGCEKQAQRRGLSTSLQGQRGLPWEITLVWQKNNREPSVPSEMTRFKREVQVKNRRLLQEDKGKSGIHQSTGEAPCWTRRTQTSLKWAMCSVTSMECVFSSVLKFWNSRIPDGQRYCCINSMKSTEILSFKIKDDRYRSHPLAPRAKRN